MPEMVLPFELLIANVRNRVHSWPFKSLTTLLQLELRSPIDRAALRKVRQVPTMAGTLPLATTGYTKILAVCRYKREKTAPLAAQVGYSK